MNMKLIRRVTLAVALVGLAAAHFASAASAAEWGFKTESSSATIVGEPIGELTWTLAGGTSHCTGGGNFEGALQSGAESFTTSHVPDWSKCLSGPMEMAGCNLSFTPGEPGSTLHPSSFSIGPEGCGPIGVWFAPGCLRAQVPAQGPKEEFDVRYTNEGSGTSAAVRAEVLAIGVGYSCDEGKTLKTDGQLIATWKLRAKNAAEEYEGLSLGKPTKFEAEKYTATLSGAGFEKFIDYAGTTTCSGTGLSGSLAAAGSQLSLLPSYGGTCTRKRGGEEASTTVNPKSCSFTLGAQNTTAPYTGTLGITCGKEGDKIVYNSYIGGFNVCSVSVGPQAGLHGINLSNLGKGAERGIGLSAYVTNVKYETKGACVTKAEVRTDGILEGAPTLTATNGGKQTGLFVAG